MIDPIKCTESSIFMDITVLQKQLLDEVMITGFEYIFSFQFWGSFMMHENVLSFSRFGEDKGEVIGYF